jgi:hypothetical protein
MLPTSNVDIAHRRRSPLAVTSLLAIVALLVPASVARSDDATSRHSGAREVARPAPTTTVFVRPGVELDFDDKSIGAVGVETGATLHVFTAQQVHVIDVDTDNVGQVVPYPLPGPIDSQPQLIDGFIVVTVAGEWWQLKPTTWVAQPLQTPPAADPPGGVSGQSLAAISSDGRVARWDDAASPSRWAVVVDEAATGGEQRRSRVVPLSMDGSGDPLMVAWATDGGSVFFVREQSAGIHVADIDRSLVATIWMTDPILGVIVARP